MANIRSWIGFLNEHMLYRVIRSFIKGTFDWQFIFESESDLRVRSTVRGGQEPERQHREAQRMGWNPTGPDHTENQSDHPAAACTASRPHTQTQSCVGKVLHFKEEGKGWKLTKSNCGGFDQCVEALSFVCLEVPGLCRLSGGVHS